MCTGGVTRGFLVKSDTVKGVLSEHLPPLRAIWRVACALPHPETPPFSQRPRGLSPPTAEGLTQPFVKVTAPLHSQKGHFWTRVKQAPHPRDQHSQASWRPEHLGPEWLPHFLTPYLWLGPTLPWAMRAQVPRLLLKAAWGVSHRPRQPPRPPQHRLMPGLPPDPSLGGSPQPQRNQGPEGRTLPARVGAEGAAGPHLCASVLSP